MIHSLDLNKRRDQTRRMLRNILGEPIYVMFSHELGLLCDGNLAGMAAVGLSALVAESMPDEYVGPGPAITVVDDHLRDGTYSPEGAAMVFDAIALHEVAHVVTFDVPYPECDGEGLRSLVKIPNKQWPAHAGQFRWLGHDCRFIRSLIHISHRMRSRGHKTYLEFAFNHEAYGLSPADEYQIALGNEPADADLKPLREVLAEPMPAKFRELWGRDVLASLKV